jgi:hypothetical protein
LVIGYLKKRRRGDISSFRRSWSRMLQGRPGTGCPSYEEDVIGQEAVVIGEEGRFDFLIFFLIQNPKFKIQHSPLPSFAFLRVHSRFILFSSFFCLKVLCLLLQEGRLRG